MPLIDLKTDLKSLKYGSDRPGGGSSREPFITTSIPDGEITPNTPDFLLRDGAIVRGAQDASRLTQLFTTFKGFKFTTNNNLLSRTSVKTEATLPLPAYAGGTANQGVYLPTSTIAQAAIAYSGTHLNLLGLDPFSPMSGVVEGGLFPIGGLIRYEEVASFSNKNGLNRLVKLKDKKIDTRPIGAVGPLGPIQTLISDLPNYSTEILSYSGGPGSILGIGDTIIKRASNTTGLNEYGWTTKDFLTDSFDNISLAKTYFNDNYSSKLKITPSSTDPTGVNILPGISKGTYNSAENFPQGVVSNNEIVTLKTAYSKPDGSELKYTMPGETRTYEANPNFIRNKYGNQAKYNIFEVPKEGTQYSYGTDPFSAPNTQTLNLSTTSSEAPDSQLFKFYLNLIDAENPSTDQYLYWQAYVDSFSDSIGADYDSYNYVGRGYPLYKYKGFNRSINLDFTITANNPTQILPIYTKLNQLIQNMAPNYSNGGYLRGNFVKLTFGDYLNNVPGIVTGFTLNPIFEAGIGLSEPGDTQKQLFKAIKVSGFNFTPIASNDNKIITNKSKFISAI